MNTASSAFCDTVLPAARSACENSRVETPGVQGREARQQGLDAGAPRRAGLQAPNRGAMAPPAVPTNQQQPPALGGRSHVWSAGGGGAREGFFHEEDCI